jgi:predicted DNA-binding transcriptional regulator AlpA
MFGIGLRTLARWRTQGIIPEPIFVNARVLRWRESDIHAALDKLDKRPA